MIDLVLIVTIAGQKVALRATDVQSVIEIDVLTAVPCAPAHIAGLSALRSRVLTVVDPQAALGLGDGPSREAGAKAAVVIHDGHAYALLLDAVEDVIDARSDPASVPGHLRGDWAAMSYGMVETDQGPLLLLDISALISGPEEARAA